MNNMAKKKQLKRILAVYVASILHHNQFESSLLTYEENEIINIQKNLLASDFLREGERFCVDLDDIVKMCLDDVL
jgi:hypothetical protein